MTRDEFSFRYRRVCAAGPWKVDKAQEIEWFDVFRKWSTPAWDKAWTRVKESLGSFMPSISDFKSAWQAIHAEELRQIREETEAKKQIERGDMNPDSEENRRGALAVQFVLFNKRLAPSGTIKRLYKPGDWSVLEKTLPLTYPCKMELREMAEKERSKHAQQDNVHA